jgi:hypothetical protein
LIATASEQVYSGLNQTSANLDVSMLAEGIYHGRVRAVIDGVKTGWCASEDVLPIFHSALSMARGLRKPDKTAQQAALELWEHVLPISATDLRIALGGAGYPEADVNLAVASTSAFPPYRHVGPVGWTSSDEVSPFDDLAALVPLHRPLSRIEIHLEGNDTDQWIVGIQGFYGSEGIPLPLHGREGYQALNGSKQVVAVTADDPIIKVSESFARVAPGEPRLRLQELIFQYRSSQTVSLCKSGGRDGFQPWTFNLPTWGGEVVVGFCGSVFSSPQWAGFSALGILTKPTEPSLHPTADPDPYHRLGPMGLPGGGRTEDQIVKFDDSEAVKALKESLSKIMVQHNSESVLGIQAFYGAAGRQQPYHGSNYGEQTTIPIAPDDPITEVLGACDRSGMGPVICRLTFHTRSGRVFGPYGKAFRSDLEPFFFATGPGEEVLAFFGSTINYVLDNQGRGFIVPADRRFLSSLGILTKHTGG